MIACDSVYGGTVKVLTRVFSRFGISARFITLNQIADLPKIATSDPASSGLSLRLIRLTG